MNFLPIDFLAGLTGGFFNRDGGVSAVPFDSLNVSYGVGDEPDRVRRNRGRLRAALGLKCLLSARQVHGDRILSLSAPHSADDEFDGYDALVTDQPGIGLMIQQADCQAVILYDPGCKVVANVHAGWRGSVANILPKTIQRMTLDFGADPGRILAAISPSLGPCCAEFIHFQSELPESFHAYQVTPAHFDFWAISRLQLEEAGVMPTQIRTAAICTRCDPHYFSYRREGRTGRSATVVALRS